jgi:hypothetical protein
MKIKTILLLGLLSVSNIAFAEGGCPLGTYPANPPATNVCNPLPDSQAPAQPQGRWETRWGAIAIGSTASGGGVGVVADMPTKRKAEKAAMSQCKTTGGWGLSAKLVCDITINAQSLHGAIQVGWHKARKLSKLPQNWLYKNALLARLTVKSYIQLVACPFGFNKQS